MRKNVTFYLIITVCFLIVQTFSQNLLFALAQNSQIQILHNQESIYQNRKKPFAISSEEDPIRKRSRLRAKTKKMMIFWIILIFGLYEVIICCSMLSFFYHFSYNVYLYSCVIFILIVMLFYPFSSRNKPKPQKLTQIEQLIIEISTIYLILFVLGAFFIISTGFYLELYYHFPSKIYGISMLNFCIVITVACLCILPGDALSYLKKFPTKLKQRNQRPPNDRSFSSSQIQTLNNQKSMYQNKKKPVPMSAEKPIMTSLMIIISTIYLIILILGWFAGLMIFFAYEVPGLMYWMLSLSFTFFISVIYKICIIKVSPKKPSQKNSNHTQPEHEPQQSQPEHKPQQFQPEHEPQRSQPEHKPQQSQPEHQFRNFV